MFNKEEQLNILDTMVTDAVTHGIAHITIDNTPLDGRIIDINGKHTINFGSCSYLGLETDHRLKEAAINAVDRYGTQFSSSRVYTSVPLYTELEELLSQIFEAPALVAPTTSLAHIAALPVLIDSNDAIIYDQQVHASVQTAMKILQSQKIYTEILRHNRVDLLPERIETLRKKYKKIWYLADGVYSMFGDLAPMNELKRLLDKYEQFNLYIDDAHGMGWIGKHGKGMALDKLPFHERMIVALSMAKGFGAGGGILVFPNRELMRKVRTCGGPMIFSGPIQPATLGAAIASAKIHLSNEITILQDELKKRQHYCNTLLSEYELPIFSLSDAPIRFIGMGLPKVAQNMIGRLIKNGFYTNNAVFPAVPMKRAGVRFTITNHQSLDDIKHLIQAMAHHFPKVMEEENTSLEEIEKAFKIKVKNSKSVNKQPPQSKIEISFSSSQAGLSLQHETTIEKMDKAEWDKLLGDKGSFTWEGLSFLERTYKNNPEPENNWNFHYYIIRDTNDIPVLATFFTDAIFKDDMLMSKDISMAVEEKRKEDKYFLTSRAFTMGSQLTEGEHLYLDRTRNWKEALSILLKEISAEQEKCGATTLILHDLPSNDPEMDEFMLDKGFVKQMMPDSMAIDITWNTHEDYLKSLSVSARRHQRQKVLPWIEQLDVEIYNKNNKLPSEKDLEHFYKLYSNVKERALEINSFPIPENTFKNMLDCSGWELISLKVKPEFGGKPDDMPVAMVACYNNGQYYCSILIGVDYDFVDSHHAYRVATAAIISRGKELRAKKVTLGLGVAFEKQQFGAKSRSYCAYMQTSDHYSMELMQNMKTKD